MPARFSLFHQGKVTYLVICSMQIAHRFHSFDLSRAAPEESSPPAESERAFEPGKVKVRTAMVIFIVVGHRYGRGWVELLVAPPERKFSTLGCPFRAAESEQDSIVCSMVQNLIPILSSRARKSNDTSCPCRRSSHFRRCAALTSAHKIIPKANKCSDGKKCWKQKMFANQKSTSHFNASDFFCCFHWRVAAFFPRVNN